MKRRNGSGAVVAEDLAVAEAEAEIERRRRLERRPRSRLEAEAGIPPVARDIDDVGQQRAPDAAAEVGGRGPHRLDLAVPRVDLAQRGAPGQRVAVPRRPEGDVGSAQPRDLKRVDARGGRVGAHPGHVECEQVGHAAVGQVVDDDAHAAEG